MRRLSSSDKHSNQSTENDQNTKNNQSTKSTETRWQMIIHSAKDFSPHENVIIRPSKINYLVLGPFFPIFDAGGRHFFFFCKGVKEWCGKFFFLPCQNCDTQNNSRINYNLFLICFTGNYIAGYRDCSVDERLGLTLTVTMFTGFRRRSSALRLGRHFPTGNI